MPFVGLADVDAHQGPLALKFFVRHVSSDMECGGLAAALTVSTLTLSEPRVVMLNLRPEMTIRIYWLAEFQRRKAASR
jgi:hypothetical protein